MQDSSIKCKFWMMAENRNIIVRLLSQIAGAVWRILLFVLASIIKLISVVLEKISNELLKHSGK